MEGLRALIKQLEIGADGAIAYASFIDNLSGKTIAWWTQYVHNNSFEHRHRVSRKGNMSTVALPHTFSFVRAGVLQRLKTLLKHEEPTAIADRVFGTNPDGSLGKSQLRKVLIVEK